MPVVQPYNARPRLFAGRGGGGRSAFLGRGPSLSGVPARVPGVSAPWSPRAGETRIFRLRSSGMKDPARKPDHPGPRQRRFPGRESCALGNRRLRALAAAARRSGQTGGDGLLRNRNGAPLGDELVVTGEKGVDVTFEAFGGVLEDVDDHPPLARAHLGALAGHIP